MDTFVEVLGYVGRGSIAAALMSVLVAATRQWHVARGLGRLAVAMAGLWMAIALVAMTPGFTQRSGEEAAERATRLAMAISEVMNSSIAFIPDAFLGGLVGAVVWAASARALRRSGS